MHIHTNTKILNNFCWPFILLVVGMLMIINQSVGFDLSSMPGNLADGRFNNYLLEHGYQYFMKDGFPYWNAPFFFPEKDVISYSDNLFGALPIYIICRFWNDRETSYQLWYLILISLNFVGAYYAFRKLNASVYTSSIGAFIYAFSSIISIQTAHIQLLARFTAPFAIVSLYLWLQGRENKYVYISIFLLVYQFYCSIYLGYFLVFVLIAMVGVHLVRERKLDVFLQLFKSRKERIQTGIYLFIALCLLCILFYPYFLRSIDGDGYPHMDVLRFYVPRLWMHFLASDNSFAWGWSNVFVTNTLIPKDSSTGEGFIFLGFLPWFFFIASLIMYRKDERIRFFLITAGVIFIVVLSVFDFSLYSYLVYIIPGARAVRVILRFVVIAIFLWSIITVLFLENFFKHGNVYTTIFIFLLPVLLVLDNTFKNPLSLVSKENSQMRAMEVVEMYKNEIYKNPHAKAFTIHFNTDSIKDRTNRFRTAIHNHMDAMMASQIIDLPCVNGYSAKVPNEYEGYFMSPNEQSLKAWLHSERIKTTVKDKYNVSDILILNK